MVGWTGELDGWVELVVIAGCTGAGLGDGDVGLEDEPLVSAAGAEEAGADVLVDEMSVAGVFVDAIVSLDAGGVVAVGAEEPAAGAAAAVSVPAGGVVVAAVTVPVLLEAPTAGAGAGAVAVAVDAGEDVAAGAPAVVPASVPLTTPLVALVAASVPLTTPLVALPLDDDDGVAMRGRSLAPTSFALPAEVLTVTVGAVGAVVGAAGWVGAGGGAGIGGGGGAMSVTTGALASACASASAAPLGLGFFAGFGGTSE